MNMYMIKGFWMNNVMPNHILNHLNLEANARTETVAISGGN